MNAPVRSRVGGRANKLDLDAIERVARQAQSARDGAFVYVPPDQRPMVLVDPDTILELVAIARGAEEAERAGKLQALCDLHNAASRHRNHGREPTWLAAAFVELRAHYERWAPLLPEADATPPGPERDAWFACSASEADARALCDCGHDAAAHGFIGSKWRSECSECSCSRFRP